MPITNTFGRMPLDKVWVERTSRQRADPDPEAGGLLQSVALRGVLMPVILEEEPNSQGYHILYAGERRYAASLRLGLDDIPFRFARAPSPREVQIIEFEENAKRKDLSWQETCQAVVTVHALHRDEDPEWTFELTGRELGWHDGSLVAKYHFIHASWLDDAVRACGTVNEAYNLLQRRQKRAQQNKLDEWLGPPQGGGGESEEETKENPDDSGTTGDVPPGGTSGHRDGVPRGADRLGDSPNGGGTTGRKLSGGVAPPPAQGSPQVPQGPILNADFRQWAPGYSGPRFNLIHCDFPYGIKLGENAHSSGSNSLSREKEEHYSDTPEDYAALLEAFITHFDRFAADACHVMFWFSNRHEIELATRAAFAKIPGFRFLRFPLVWHKSDNAGFMTPGHPRHIYETCLVGGRGDRPIVKYVSDCYSSPTDNSLHLSAKPEPMLRYFMSMFCDEHSRVLDPTCGGGSALRAAEALRAERVLGLELNPQMTTAANVELLRARALRRAAEATKRGTK